MVTDWLYSKIRNASEPDNIDLILKDLSEQANEFLYSVFEHRLCLEDQIWLLLETASDESLPISWRKLCMNYMDVPFSILRNLADSDSAMSRMKELSHCKLAVLNNSYEAARELHEELQF